MSNYPFFASGGIYIPVITKAQSVDGLLEEVALIFVEVNDDRLRPLFDWSLPKNMPDMFAMLVKLIRMMFRARWEILEPRYQEAKYRNPTPDRCAEIVRSVIDDYGRMRQDAENQGITGLDKFYAVFSADLRDPIEACGDEWTSQMRKLAADTVANSDDLSVRLKDLLKNNAKWLELSASQFARTAAELR